MILERHEALPRALVACFVAEQVEVSLDAGGEPFDPTVPIERWFGPLLASSPPDRFALYEGVDRLAELARRKGHGLRRIARNLDAMRAAIDALR